MAEPAVAVLRDETRDFVQRLAEDWDEDASHVLHALVTRGRLLLAIDAVRDDRMRLKAAAELAGLPLGAFVEALAEYGADARVGEAEYEEALENLREVW